MNQSNNNGESQSRTRRLAPKHHNAKLCPLAIRERIVNALANGDSKRSIARALKVSIHTVNAIEEQDWQQVATRKTKLAARYEKLADLYTERQIDELESGAKIPLNLCQSGGGIATDKAMALRSGDPSLTIQHNVSLHKESETEALQRLYDLIASVAASFKIPIAEVPTLPPTDAHTNPIQIAGVHALNFVNRMAQARQRAKAKVVDAELVSAFPP